MTCICTKLTRKLAECPRTAASSSAKPAGRSAASRLSKVAITRLSNAASASQSKPVSLSPAHGAISTVGSLGMPDGLSQRSERGRQSLILFVWTI